MRGRWGVSRRANAPLTCARHVAQQGEQVQSHRGAGLGQTPAVVKPPVLGVAESAENGSDQLCWGAWM